MSEQNKYYELDQDVVDHFMKIFNSKSFPVNVKFQFIGTTKQKELVKIRKITDEYAFLLNDKEILVSINEDVYHAMDDEIVDILLETSIESISVNIDTGKISLGKPTLQTYPSIVNKYGVTKVGRACQIEDLYDEQQKDDTFEI